VSCISVGLVRIYIVLSAMVLLAPLWDNSARADEVGLANGDRYSGMVLSLASGMLAFDTGHGRVDLPWPGVSALTVDMPIVVTADGASKQTVARLESTDGWVVLADGTPVPLSALRTLARPQSPFRVSGGASAGVLATGGNTAVNSIRVDADVVARLYENRYTARSTVNRSKDSGVETARDASAEFRYDRFFTRTVFANGSALFTSDKFRDLDLRSNLGVGIGVQLADDTRAKVQIEGGYGYVSERYASSLEPDRNYSALREATNMELYFVTKRVVVFHRSDNFLSFSDSTQTQLGTTAVRNINVQMHNGVRIGLGLGLVMTLQFDFDYVRSPAAGRKTTDRRAGLTFGYRF